MKPKVVIVERIFSFYRKPVFDKISQQTELKLLCGKNNSGIKTLETDYSESVPSIQFGKKDTFVLIFPLINILKYRPEVVICDFALGMLNLPFIILGCKLFGIKFAFWSHGYNRKTGFQPERSWADKYRLLLLKWVDANIVYSQSDRELLSRYINRDSLFVAQNTLDTEMLSKIKLALEREGREEVKKRLGIRHTFNLAFIGRMLPSKRPDLLLDVYSLLNSQYGLSPGIHFIGGGPMFSVLKERVEQNFPINDFYFHGPIHDPEQNGALLFASDIMVLPGDLGLSINHAFCFDCPVLSFNRKNGHPAHGPEIEYLIPDKTGFLLDDHRPEAMAEVISKYLHGNGIKKSFQKNIQHVVKEVFPLEKMVEGIMDCINYLKPR